MRYVCLDCDREFSEDEAVQVEETLSTLQDERMVFVDFRCPRCESDDIEDIDNLEALREMKGH